MKISNMKLENMKLENIVYILLLIFFGTFILLSLFKNMNGNSKENMTGISINAATVFE